MFERRKENETLPEENLDFVPETRIPDTPIEFQTALINLKAEQLFKHINKDIVLSKLNEREIYGLRAMAELIGFAEFYGLKELKKMYLHDFFMILATSRARYGFEREMLVTGIGVSKLKTDKTNKKRKWI